MNADSIGWAFLFLVVVAVFIVAGVLVGIIVAGRMDAFQAPRPAKPADDPVIPAPAPDATQEDQQP